MEQIFFHLFHYLEMENLSVTILSSSFVPHPISIQ